MKTTAVASGSHKQPEGITGGRLRKGSPAQQGCCVKTMPLTGRLTERVRYGNKYKHISTINRNIAPTVERHVEPVTRTLVFRFEGYFAGG
jgi:hypothetical protein